MIKDCGPVYEVDMKENINKKIRLTKDLLWDFFLHFCFNSFNDMIMLSSQD